MEALRQARNLYVKSHGHHNTVTNRDHGHDDTGRFIAIAIKEQCDLQKVFTNTCLLNVMKASLKEWSTKETDLIPVINAFFSLEKYMLLLASQPWKPEYKKLKTYGGFYRTRIKSVLLTPEEIFFAAGYQLKDKEVLTHSVPLDKNTLLMLAFDCRLAACECQSVQDEFKQYRHMGKTLSSVIRNKLGFKFQDELIDFSEKSDSEKKSLELQHLDKGNSFSVGHTGAVSASTLSGIQTAPSVFDKKINEKVSESPEATLDEHLQESLRMVERNRPGSSKNVQSLAHNNSKPFLSDKSSDLTNLKIENKPSRNYSQSQANFQSLMSQPVNMGTYPPLTSGKYRSAMYPSSVNSEASNFVDEGIQEDYPSYSKTVKHSLKKGNVIADAKTSIVSPHVRSSNVSYGRDESDAPSSLPPTLTNRREVPAIPSRALKPSLHTQVPRKDVPPPLRGYQTQQATAPSSTSTYNSNNSTGMNLMQGEKTYLYSQNAYTASKKNCPRCTFENDINNKTCECCQSRLE